MASPPFVEFIAALARESLPGHVIKSRIGVINQRVGFAQEASERLYFIHTLPIIDVGTWH